MRFQDLTADSGGVAVPGVSDLCGGRSSRLDVLEEPLGYVDGMSLHEYVGSDPVDKHDPLGLLALPQAIMDATVAAYNAKTSAWGKIVGTNGGMLRDAIDLRVKQDDQYGPYAVAHGVKVALKNLDVKDIGKLPVLDKNFTKVTCAQHDSIKGVVGEKMKGDVSTHASGVSSIDLGKGYALKFYPRKDGDYDTAVVHATGSEAHVDDALHFHLGQEVNGDIAEQYGGFAVVTPNDLNMLKSISNQAFLDFNDAHPVQYDITAAATTQPTTQPTTRPTTQPTTRPW